MVEGIKKRLCQSNKTPIIIIIKLLDIITAKSVDENFVAKAVFYI